MAPRKRARLRPLGLGVCLALALSLAAPASAEETFTFYGSGWGHGIGLSQYGAYGLAKEGWSSSTILKHYYQGAKVGSRSAPARRFRIGLAQSRSSITVSAELGSFKVVARGKVVARVRQGRSRRFRVSSGVLRMGRKSLGSVAKVKRGRGAIIHVSQLVHSLNRGRLEISAASSSRAHAVAILRPEQYLRGLAEVPSSWPMAALQAQAIAGRTYAFRKVADSPGQRRSGCACGLYASTRDQYYAGATKELGSSGSRWVEAVKSTKSTVATYNGSLITTFYSSSSGGFTENVENVWSGSSAKPYLKGVCDPGDFVDANSNRTWSQSFGASSVTRKLRSLTGNIGTVTGFSDYTLGVSGRVKRVRVNGTSGSKTVDGWDLRGELGLKDTRFRVNRNLNVTGRIRQRYDALGCAPGRATGEITDVPNGRFQDFEEGRIYLTRSTDVSVWLRGAVLDHYLARGGHASSLGLPVDLVRSADGTWVGSFQGGTITCPPSGSCSSS
ncbi:MAG TPA: SpoIID/LytB domain-containing protein [Actinomycetota bacterium]|nr:SpoIID/LytB domain-containing protein [Actinomycetota bacterium]